LEGRSGKRKRVLRGGNLFIVVCDGNVRGTWVRGEPWNQVRVDQVDGASHTSTWIKEESGRKDGQNGLGKRC
jgi:hypothetical protein